MSEHLVVLGGSYAGYQLAATARQLGYSGSITLVSEERGLPYQRPPLSKGFLKGDMTADRLPLTGPEFFTEAKIRHLDGVSARRIDPVAKEVELDNGEHLSYSWLGYCLGAKARALEVPGADLDSVHTLRTLSDARRIMEDLEHCQRVCVIGAGFIGLEVASVCRQMGKAVTVVEAGTDILSRALPPFMQTYLRDQHRKQGVQFQFSTKVLAIEKTENGDLIVKTDQGDIVCETAVVGIGAIPNKQLAEVAGARVERAVLTDAFGRTSLDHVVAAGDCASFPSQYAREPGTKLSLESIQAARDTAKAAASVVAGCPRAFSEVPWFWTDQYHLKLQIAGIYDKDLAFVTRGDPATDKFSLIGLREGSIRCAFSINKPADHMAARKLIEANVAVSESRVCDTQVKLKDFLHER